MIKFDDLLKVKEVQSIINNKLDKIKQLEENFDGLHSQKITEKVQGGKTQVSYQEKRLEQIEKLKNEVWELVGYQNAVQSQINKLTNYFHQMLLVDEYILGNDVVERRRQKKGERMGYTKKELKEALKEAEASFMLLCMSESLKI